MYLLVNNVFFGISEHQLEQLELNVHFFNFEPNIAINCNNNENFLFSIFGHFFWRYEGMRKIVDIHIIIC